MSASTDTVATAQTTSSQHVTVHKEKRDWWNVGFTIWGVLVYVFLFTPLLMIFAYSFNTGRALLAFTKFGFGSFPSALSQTELTQPVKVSIFVAIGASVIATLIGTLAGIALARRPGKWTLVFIGLLALVLVTPEIVDGISLLLWFTKLGASLGNGWIRLMIGTSLFAIAVVTLIVRARMSGLDESLEEAAADLYATPWNRFRQITLPLVMPAVIASLLLSFSLSLDNTIIAQFVSKPGLSPWPVYVWGSIRQVMRPEIAAMSTMLMLLTLFALVVTALVLRRSGESSTAIATTMAGG
jgi:ABC-type spermidine/putrescine transport system permease subunit II